MPLPDLRTPRLVLRDRERDDIEGFVAMDCDPRVVAMLGLRETPTPEARREHLRARFASGWPERGGIWTATGREDGAVLGWCGLFPLDNSDFIEIGYRYLPPAWGRGLAPEAGRAVLDHGFGVMGSAPTTGVSHPANGGSQNVLRKIGLQRRGDGFHYGLTLPFFRLDRADYLARAAPAGDAGG